MKLTDKQKLIIGIALDALDVSDKKVAGDRTIGLDRLDAMRRVVADLATEIVVKQQWRAATA